MEKEQVQYRDKLEEISDRVTHLSELSTTEELDLTPVAQDRQDLMVIVSAAYGVIDTFKRRARNIRNNNHNLNPEWDARSKALDDASRTLSLELDKAVRGLTHEL